MNMEFNFFSLKYMLNVLSNSNLTCSTYFTLRHGFILIFSNVIVQSFGIALPWKVLYIPNNLDPYFLSPTHSVIFQYLVPL